MSNSEHTAAGREWLTIGEAAAELGVHETTIRRWCKTNELPHKRVGRTIRLHRDDLAARERGEGRAAGAATAVAEPAGGDRRPDAPTRPARVIALANQKGGVGKTTTAINLGVCLAQAGWRTLIVDVDPQANSSLGLLGSQDVSPSLADVLLTRTITPAAAVRPTSVPGLAILPGSLLLSNVEAFYAGQLGREYILRPIIAAVRDDFDFILFDCPPSVGILTVAALLAARELIIPVSPQMFSIAGLRLFDDTLTTVREVLGYRDLRLLGVLVNRTPPQRDGTLHAIAFRGILNDLRRHYGDHLLTTMIPEAAAVEEAHQAQVGVAQWKANSAVAHAFRQLAREVVAHGQ